MKFIADRPLSDPDNAARKLVELANTAQADDQQQMRRDGTLQEFNARYKAGRAAAIAEGKGYMGFGVAMARFKKALIPLLMNRPPEPGRMRSIFEDVFR